MNHPVFDLAWISLEVLKGFSKETTKEWANDFLANNSDHPAVAEARKEFAIAIANHNGV